ncbi:MAG: helix-turn-helix domain-containing protein [Chloroflexi bacterium]|nr:helix-turn-helix domain-containing protein [Chloroflexota bacterium]
MTKSNWNTNKPTNSVDPIEIPNDRLLKAMDVAKILGVSRAMAYRLMQSKIHTVNIGKARRVRPIELKKFISENQNSVD